MEEVERYLEKEREKRRESLPKKDASLREYLFHCHKKKQDKLLCPRCNIICNPRIAAEFERAQRERTGVNWRQDNPLYRVYPNADEILLEFLVRCHKIGTKCLICPRCAAVYDREMAEAFERIPFVSGWGHQGRMPSNPINAGRTMPRRPDSPYPRGAKKVSFKLPTEIPTDRWLQV